MTAKFIPDLAGPVRDWPTSLMVFFDGDDPRLKRAATRYRLASRRRRDLRWRDIRGCPNALALFGIAPEQSRHRLFVVDRRARLRRGLDARIKLWAELPGWRLLAGALTLLGVKALVSRPVKPPRRSCGYAGLAERT